MLVALLLPAVQAAREAARRTHCANNLKQLGVALHNYHDRCRSFPPSTVVDWNRPEPTGWWSWIVRLLPELEERALYDQFDVREDVWTNSTRYKPHTSTRLAVLLCPSDPNGERVYKSDELSDVDEAFALTNYLGCRGSKRQAAGPAGRGLDEHGLGDYVLDVSEGLHEGSLVGDADLLHYWSAHPQGAHFAMCDGSVRFLTYAIDPSAFQALGSRNGGEVVSSL
jgi:prepilin-type processing-associated H-X9-DG protein